LFLLFLKQQNHNRAARAARATTPPITPPAIGPADDELEDVELAVPLLAASDADEEDLEAEEELFDDCEARLRDEAELSEAARAEAEDCTEATEAELDAGLMLDVVPVALRKVIQHQV